MQKTRLQKTRVQKTRVQKRCDFPGTNQIGHSASLSWPRHQEVVRELALELALELELLLELQQGVELRLPATTWACHM